ncbi:IS630 family transposase [Candidatus Bealeia paramacronuclearis]|uniref:IS630 family transposase n=2 Tax=Candidatus Bealeia paramacronuclearis TaxID=1921001 RepID=A0ABZ2C622_9PROT|nr:IS630 family transposase [Candidatus Bealeia paramacronuclearis]
MKLGDARKLTQDAQESLRLRGIKAVVEGGKTHAEVGHLLGVARGTVSRWVSSYRRRGQAALLKKKRGRRAEDMVRLKPHQCASLVKMITDRCPDQLKLPFMLWTREAVGELIERTFGIRLSIRSVGNYLKRWGFTPQKPVRRAYERREKEVQAWLKEVYPAIAKRARLENAEIHWGDEAGFRSDHQTGTTYSPKGQTPVISGTGKRFRINMISSVTNQGTLRFMLFEENFTREVFLNFLKRLIKSSKKKVFLIVDNHKVHHAKVVGEFLKENKEKIEVFFLPAYSPDLNPDELFESRCEKQCRWA